jgi:Kef-type K+ transport system membrane component KefB
MLWWTVILIVLVVLSFISQLGILFSLQVKFPVLSALFLNILILASLVAVLYRILTKRKKGEKEVLLKKIQDLEQEVETLKGKAK